MGREANPSASPGTMMSELVRQHNARVRSRTSGSAGGVTAQLPATMSTGVVVGNHVVQVKLGSRKTELSLVLDTGSDVTWTQCQPCGQDSTNCYSQRETIFDPSTSESYQDVPCNSSSCTNDVFEATGAGPQCLKSTKNPVAGKSTCTYGTAYASPDTYSSGNLGMDNLTLTAGAGAIRGFIFGCGQVNGFSGRDEAGMMGLGRSRLSIVSQTAKTFGKRFSYCLPTERGTGGHLTFGSPLPAAAKVTPFAVTARNGYFIDVLDISVNGQALNIGPQVFNASGTIIDSGASFSMLPPAAFGALNDSFVRHLSKYPRAKGDGKSFNTCFNFTGFPDYQSIIPKISYTFAGPGKDPSVVHLNPSVAMVAINLKDPLSQVCLAFGANRQKTDVGVFGNWQQQSLEVFYDVAGGKLGFIEAKCT
ncbi:unnamed protein product [Cuscuta europaea]|nr:unnamed protein product [Cuscuta europaea]